ncbi:putative acetyl-CoA C-acyltransferase [Helianthus annuus]|nr:putative acetyl-CoA C-acyltransferase [Helianthus annuus]
MKASAATAAHTFKDEIIPIKSQVSNHTGVVVLMKRSVALQKRLPTIGLFWTFVVVGVPPAIMGIGLAVAVKVVGLQIEIDDIDLFEIREDIWSFGITTLDH